MNYPLIDAHAHLWLHVDTVVNGQPIHPMAHNRSRSLFFGEEVQMLPPYLIDGKNTAEIFLSNMDYARVSAAVITQEFIDGLQNDYLADVARRYPDRFFVFGMADYRVEGWMEEVRRLVDAGFRGIKVPAARMTDTPLNGAEMMPLFDYLEERGVLLGIELAEGPRQAAEMEDVVRTHPQLQVVIGHFGMSPRDNWFDQIRLARHPHVYIESGGITWLYNAEFYPYPSAMQAIRQAADEVGMEKLMWGSDYPRTITAITYKMSYDFVLKSPLLTDEEKRLFLGDNARRVFGFKKLVELPYIKNMSE